MKIQLQTSSEVILESTVWIIKCTRRLSYVILAVHVLTSKKSRDFHQTIFDKGRFYCSSESRFRHLLFYTEHEKHRKKADHHFVVSAVCHIRTLQHRLKAYGGPTTGSP